jgi:aspartyl-tRNA(Asn)/glutamyl-tRNA(Gln) amidotransferase subunit C
MKFARLRRQKSVCYRLSDNSHMTRNHGVRGLSCARNLSMSVDIATVRRIAHLARIAVKDDEVEHLKGEINDMLAFVEQLSEVDISGVEPMTSVTPMAMKKRPDVVTDGEIADDILQNAPAAQDHFFLVPKVVE